MSGADSTTEMTPTGRYEDHSLALACPGQCSLKAKLQTCARHGAKFDQFVNLVAS